MVSAAVCMVSPAYAQEGEVARTRLEESRQAIQNLESLMYTGTVEAEGGLFGTIQELNSQVWMQRQGEGAAGDWDHRRKGMVVVRSMETDEDGNPKTESVEFDVLRKGPNVTYVAHDLRTVYERYHRAARHRSVTVAQTGWIAEFADDTPFERELTLPEVKLTLEIGADTVGEDVCDVVEISFGDQRQVVRWSISQQSDLPRRKETRLGADNMQKYTITNIAINEEIPAEVWEFERPEGYAFNSTVRNPQQARQPQRTTYPNAKPFEVTIAEGPDKGETVSLESLEGNVVVLDFWTGWSGTSKDSRSDIQAIAEQFKDQPVRVLSMTWRERNRVQAGIDAWKDSGGTYSLATGADEIAMDYAVSSFPTVFVVTQDGKLVYTLNEYNAENFRTNIAEQVQKALDGEFSGDAATTLQSQGNQTTTTTEQGGTQTGGNQGGGNQGGNQGGGNQGGNQGGGNQGGNQPK
jgi:thiol-disulfide isomerase/thioredoxin